MTPTQRDTLAVRFAQTWPNGPGQTIWAESIDDLDYPQAAKAYDKLRREEERPPSIARFLSAYRTFDTAPQWARPLGDNGPAMSFDQYIGRLSKRANEGEQEAEAMLDIWTDNEHRGLSIRQMGWKS